MKETTLEPQHKVGRLPKGKIPVSAAKKVAEQYGLKQCILLGWDGELTHVVTYGKTKADCEAAAQAQDFWAGRIKEFSLTTAKVE